MSKLKFLVLAIALSFSFLNTNAQNESKISLIDIWASANFYPASINEIRSMNDGDHYCILKSGKIIEEYQYKNGKSSRVIIGAQDLVYNDEKITIDDYNFNYNETKILIATETEPIYRHSSKSFYYIFDIKTKEIKPLIEKDIRQVVDTKTGESNNVTINKPIVRLAEFSPDGKKVAYVLENNLYYIDLESGETTKITEDGEDDKIINGTADWVYEEEFSFTKGFFWSPDSKYISYFKMDESNVKKWNLTFWGDLYPEEYEYKYPKAGEDNSIVEIWIYNMENNNHNKVNTGEDTDVYYPRMQWTKANGELSIQKLNRLQNHFEILVTNVSNYTTTTIFTDDSKYYVDIFDNLTFVDANTFIINSEKDGYNHIYQCTYGQKTEKQLTTGNFDIVEITAYDKANNLLYYTASLPTPMDHTLWCLNLKTAKTQQIGNNKGHTSAVFSNNYNYYIQTWSDINHPPVYSICDSKGKEKLMLEDNEAMNTRLADFECVDVEFIQIPNENEQMMNAWIVKPADFDATKEYPVFMYVYGGPGSQTVENTWGWFNAAWFQMLAQQGYIVVSVDGRGTGGRGEEYKKCTYLQLGKYETEDQIAAAKYLGTLDYVDADRIGMFGWSYGGYMTTLCMTKGADVFSTGIAVAPVTNWRYYDNIYTERFMRTPQENPDGYDDNSPINHVKKLKGDFLLVHGTADDNVHVQNSYELINALVSYNKDFDLMVYPNRNHGIYGGYTRLHLYRLMTKFINENL